LNFDDVNIIIMLLLNSPHKFENDLGKVEVNKRIFGSIKPNIH